MEYLVMMHVNYNTIEGKVVMRSFARFLLKYTPYFVSIFYTAFCLLRGIGLENMHITMFFAYVGLFWAPYHFASSYSSGFCHWHRRLIWYQGITGIMTFFEIWWGFGPVRVFLNWIFFAWGLILCTIVAHRIHTKQFCN